MNSLNRHLELELDMERSQEDAMGEPQEGDRQWLQRLPGLLRTLGAVAVLFSLYTFLVHGWEGSRDVLRYMMLLGHTGALGVIGLVSGHYLKEGKGARLLLTLALISVTANFAVLGGFILSATSVSQGIIYPGYFAWTSVDMGSALLLTAGSMAVLLPVILIGFLTLARGINRRMSGLFIIGNIALLLPLRDPLMVAIMAVVLAFIAIFVTGKTARDYSGSRTFEGVVTLLLQFTPVAILLGRNMWLYSPELLLISVGLFTLYIASRQITLQLEAESRLRTTLDGLSMLLATATGMSVFATTAYGHGSGALAITMGTLVAALMNYELSSRANTNRGVYRIIASGIATFGLLTSLLSFGGLMPSITALVAGLAMVVISYNVEQRAIFLGGLTLTLSGLGNLLIEGFSMFNYKVSAIRKTDRLAKKGFNLFFNSELLEYSVFPIIELEDLFFLRSNTSHV